MTQAITIWNKYPEHHSVVNNTNMLEYHVFGITHFQGTILLTYQETIQPRDAASQSRFLEATADGCTLISVKMVLQDFVYILFVVSILWIPVFRLLKSLFSSKTEKLDIWGWQYISMISEV